MGADLGLQLWEEWAAVEEVEGWSLYVVVVLAESFLTPVWLEVGRLQCCAGDSWHGGG